MKLRRPMSSVACRDGLLLDSVDASSVARQRIVQDTINFGDRTPAVNEQLFLYFGTCSRSLLTMFVSCPLQGRKCLCLGRFHQRADLLTLYRSHFAQTLHSSCAARKARDISKFAPHHSAPQDVEGQSCQLYDPTLSLDGGAF